MSSPAQRKTTLDEFWALPEGVRFHELVGGQLLPKAAPTAEHGDAQAGIIAAVRVPFQRKSGGGSGEGPGGWWIASEVRAFTPSPSRRSNSR